MTEDRALEQFRDERVRKIENRLSALEKTVNEKLIPTNTQISEALDRIGKGQDQLRVDFKEALAVTQKTISEATVEYVDRRMTGQPAAGQGQLTVQQGSSGKTGALDRIFDKIGPTMEKVLDRYANSSSLPFLNIEQPGIATEIVDVERQIKLNATMMYRNELKEMNRRLAVKLGLPAQPLTESVRVGASHG